MVHSFDGSAEERDQILALGGSAQLCVILILFLLFAVFWVRIQPEAEYGSDPDPDLDQNLSLQRVKNLNWKLF